MEPTKHQIRNCVKSYLNHKNPNKYLINKKIIINSIANKKIEKVYQVHFSSISCI